MANLWVCSHRQILSNWSMTPTMEIRHITDSTLLMLGILFYQYLHVGGGSQRLLRPTVPYKLWDSAGHPASPHPTLGTGTPGSHCCFPPGSYLLKNPSPRLRYWVGVWHLLDIGRFGFFKMLMKPRGLSSHDLVNCILESEIWVQVGLSRITRSWNRFRLQLQHKLVYAWKRPQRNYVRRKLLRLLSKY